MRLRAAALAPLIPLAVLCICTPTAGAAGAAGPAATVTRSADVSFENCIARHITVSATVPRHAFTSGEPVRVTVRIHNSSAVTCGPVTQQTFPQRQTLTVGPCGTLSMIVRTTSGAAIFPGPIAYHCPLEVGFQLNAHSTATAVGTWDQSESLPQNSPGLPRAKVQQAPPGPYRLVVDGAVAVPVILIRG